MSWICSARIELKGQEDVETVNDFSYAVSFGHRFIDDKVIFASEKKIVVIDGVLPNKAELLKKYSVDNLNELIKEYQDDIFREFIGPFSGFVYEIEVCKLAMELLRYSISKSKIRWVAFSLSP